MSLPPWLTRSRFSWLDVICVGALILVCTILQVFMPWWLADLALLGFTGLLYAAATMAEHHRTRRAA